MARLGKKPILIPEGVKVKQEKDVLIFEGKNGKLEQIIPSGIEVVLEGNSIILKNLISPDNRKLYRKTEALQGLMRKLILNKINGVKEKFEKVLELHGVGYKGEVQGKKLVLSIGFSIPVEIEIPQGIEVEVVRNTMIFVRGTDKEQVGNFSASIRAIFPPEPYKGKGIRYRGEYVRHKAGKTGVGATQ
ncbi:MAG TPA: 50S ribosomal protein L6 [bacterium]|nr:50S ribosomal protein L6 [bacterium]HPP29476.1 50S ribosomal protein L6 [bacterium]